MESLTVTGSDFSERHRKIFDAMLAVFSKHASLDQNLVLDELRRRRQIWPGAALYISSLSDAVGHGMALRDAPLKGHCERVKSTAIRRKLALLCEQTLSACRDATAVPAEMLDHHLASACFISAERSDNASLGLVCAADVAPESMKMLIDPYIPAGKLVLLVGDPGQGKTFVALGFGAGITSGRPPFSELRKPQNVLYLSNEDSPAILRARLDALGGDPARIWFESPERAISLTDHGGIEAAIKKHEAALVVVDTLTTHFGAKVDFHKANEVSAVLSPLVALAERSGATVLGLMHMSKSAQTHSLYRVQGSTAFAGAARSILAIGPDPSDPTTRVLTHLKANGTALGPSRRFTIGGDGVRWGDITELRAEDVLRSEATSEDRSATAAAVAFLQEALANGERNMKEIESEARANEIPKRTLMRAKANLGVRSRKTGFAGQWMWSLLGKSSQESEECQVCQEPCQNSLSLT
jgi:hypothetical protein